MSAPTSVAQRPSTPGLGQRALPAALGEHPASTAPTGCGSRASGPGAGVAAPRPRRRPTGRPRAPACPLPLALRETAGARRSTRRFGSMALSTASPQLVRCPAVGAMGAAARGLVLRAIVRRSAHRTRRTCPAVTSNRAPGQRRRDVLGHRGGDRAPARPGRRPVGQPLAPRGVQLGEHVVEDQHRLAAVGRAAARSAPAAAPARTTRLAVAGVALGRQSPRLSTRSSRCGPTSVTPRSSSCGRTPRQRGQQRRASAPPVGGPRRCRSPSRRGSDADVPQRSAARWSARPAA